MALSLHPRSNDFAVLTHCPEVPWSGRCIRSTGISYANSEDLISGEGSKRFGGRFNPIGIVAVYGSLDLDTSIAEYMAQRRHGLSDTEADVFPMVSVSLEVDMRRMLDLTDFTTRRFLKITKRELTDDSWQDLQEQGQESLTQAIGRLAREALFEGVLFPSAANKPKGKNLVVFPDLLASGNLRILRKEQLPPRKSTIL